MDTTPHGSRVVPHPSTKRAQTALTSVIGRERVHYGWYGRIRCWTAVVRLYSLWPGAQRVSGWDKSAPQAYHEPTKESRPCRFLEAPQVLVLPRHIIYATQLQHVYNKIQKKKRPCHLLEAPQVLVLPRHIDVLNAKSNGGCYYNRVIVR